MVLTVVLLPILLEDPWAGHGTANIRVASADGEEVRLVSLEARNARPQHDSFAKRVASGRESLWLRVTAPAGPREVTIRFRRGKGLDEESFHLPVTLIADSACTVTLRFEAGRFHAGDCTGNFPGSYGGTWPH